MNNNKYSKGNPERIKLEQLDTITLSDYGFTASAIKGEMFGMEVVDPQSGEPLDEAFYKSKIEKAISLAEQKFDIAIFPRLLEENHDYNSQDFNSYMYIHTFKRPIIQVEDISVEIHRGREKKFPSNTWKVYPLAGHVEILSSPLRRLGHGSMMYDPIRQYHNPYAYPETFAPQLIQLEYVTGLLPRSHAGYNKDWEMPASLEEYIVKSVVKQIFQVYGRMIVPVGTQGYSLSLDGITESVSSSQTSTNTAVAGEIKQLNADLSELEDAIKSYFGEGFITV